MKEVLHYLQITKLTCLLDANGYYYLIWYLLYCLDNNKKIYLPGNVGPYIDIPLEPLPPQISKKAIICPFKNVKRAHF